MKRAGAQNPLQVRRVREILTAPPAEAERLFAQYSVDEQRDMVLACGPEERLKLLYLPHDSTELVRALPPQEFFRTVRDVKWEAQEVVEVASEEQINFVLDRACWEGERLDSRTFNDWLRLFLACSDIHAERIIRTISVDLLALILKKHVRFSGDIIIDDVSYHCDPDMVRGSNVVVRAFLARLYALDPDFWVRLMYWTRIHSRATLMADAIAAREFRLSGRGFPSAFSALAIYDPVEFDIAAILAPWYDRFREAPRGGAGVIRSERQPLFLWRLAERLADLGTGEAAAKRFENQVVELSNKVMVADRLDENDPDARRRAMDKARRWTNLGLEAAAAGDLDSAMIMLKGKTLESFFRIAAMLFEALGNAVIAAEKADRGAGGRGIRRSPLAPAFAALRRPEPALVDGDHAVRQIASLSEYHQAWTVIWNLARMAEAERGSGSAGAGR